MVLQKLFFAKEKLKAANALHAFLSTTTEGLCAVIGQHHIYTAAQIHTAKVAALQQEVEQLLWEEYTGKAEDKILAIARRRWCSNCLKQFQYKSAFTGFSITAVKVCMVLKLSE